MAAPTTPSGITYLVGQHSVPEDWPLVSESGRTFKEKLRNGFFTAYMSGDVILDVGYNGGFANALPIFPHAIGIDLDYPGYDGITLPFADGSVDTVYSSHMLEHVADYIAVIRDWHRVLRDGGFIVCTVPHQFLYEKRRMLPSSWNGDHKRFYTPSSLLHEFEEALMPNTYRIRHLCDRDDNFNYEAGPDLPPDGCYEIELVIQKRSKPHWDIADESTPWVVPDKEIIERQWIGFSE